MIHILIRVILTPITFLIDVLIVNLELILNLTLAQERFNFKPKRLDGKNYNTSLLLTRELWRRPYFKNN